MTIHTHQEALESSFGAEDPVIGKGQDVPKPAIGLPSDRGRNERSYRYVNPHCLTRFCGKMVFHGKQGGNSSLTLLLRRRQTEI